MEVQPTEVVFVEGDSRLVGRVELVEETEHEEIETTTEVESVEND